MSEALDPKAIERVVRMGGREAALEILDRFLSMTERLDGLAELEPRALEQTTHRITSDAGWLGALKVRESSSLVELLASQGRLEEAAGHFELLRRLCQEVREPLLRQRGSLA
ncbi:MAG: hypothetical protein HY319_17160 [Armatimonadetes bacterium]|nr:hypothetical protein [Armatimonadota bacterium]